jgi:hypothetical protein
MIAPGALLRRKCMLLFAQLTAMGLFLGTGVFLLMHGHPVAGGFCIFVGACFHFGDSAEES